MSCKHSVGALHAYTSRLLQQVQCFKQRAWTARSSAASDASIWHTVGRLRCCTSRGGLAEPRRGLAAPSGSSSTAGTAILCTQSKSWFSLGAFYTACIVRLQQHNTQHLQGT